MRFAVISRGASGRRKRTLEAHGGESWCRYCKAAPAEQGDRPANSVRVTRNRAGRRASIADSHLLGYEHGLRSGVQRCVLQLPVWRIIDYGAESYKRRKTPL